MLHCTTINQYPAAIAIHRTMGNHTALQFSTSIHRGHTRGVIAIQYCTQSRLSPVGVDARITPLRGIGP